MNMKQLVLGLVLSTVTVGTILSSPAKAQFVDQDMIGDWSADEIAVLVEAGVLAGYPDGTFRPTNNLTREEFAVALSGPLPAEIVGVAGLHVSFPTGIPFHRQNEWTLQLVNSQFCKHGNVSRVRAAHCTNIVRSAPSTWILAYGLSIREICVVFSCIHDCGQPNLPLV